MFNVSEHKKKKKRGSKEKEKAGARDILGLGAVLSKDERNDREENPMTYQKTELQLVTPACQELRPAEESLPVGWQPNIELISLHHILLHSYQVSLCHIGLLSGKPVKNPIAFLK